MVFGLRGICDIAGSCCNVEHVYPQCISKIEFPSYICFNRVVRIFNNQLQLYADTIPISLPSKKFVRTEYIDIIGISHDRWPRIKIESDKKYFTDSRSNWKFYRQHYKFVVFDSSDG